MITSSVEIQTERDLKTFYDELKALSNNQVLVGVPEETNSREDKNGPGNAALARIHDKGSPLAGIPARPFMAPGIKKAQKNINIEMKQAALASVEGKEEEVQQALKRAGLWAQMFIQDTIEKGEGFAPLKRATLLARLRRRKSLWKYYHKPWMKEAKETFLAGLKPLIDTSELLKSITFVIRRIKK
jgi:hypothetical protein